MQTAFDRYRLSDDQEELRVVVRRLAERQIAPHAAEADETASFPKASYDALRQAGYDAPHVPEEYGGAGADSLATSIVIEEVSRVCASTSLIPAVNKLGSMPLILAASEDVKQRF